MQKLKLYERFDTLDPCALACGITAPFSICTGLTECQSAQTGRAWSALLPGEPQHLKALQCAGLSPYQSTFARMRWQRDASAVSIRIEEVTSDSRVCTQSGPSACRQHFGDRPGASESLSAAQALAQRRKDARHRRELAREVVALCVRCDAHGGGVGTRAEGERVSRAVARARPRPTDVGEPSGSRREASFVEFDAPEQLVDGTAERLVAPRGADAALPRRRLRAAQHAWVGRERRRVREP
eukprot:4233490-Pleurochrysis_carterae.AAC.4